MRLAINIIITLFCTVSSYGSVKAQFEQDSSVLNFIAQNYDYIPFKKFPDSLSIYLFSIVDFLATRDTNPNDYWLDAAGIKNDSNIIMIPIHHYDGFVREIKLQKEMEELNKNRKKGEWTVISINGNMSGKDGYLEIDRFTRKVVSFGLWQ